MFGLVLYDSPFTLGEGFILLGVLTLFFGGILEYGVYDLILNLNQLKPGWTTLIGGFLLSCFWLQEGYLSLTTGYMRNRGREVSQSMAMVSGLILFIVSVFACVLLIREMLKLL